MGCAIATLYGKTITSVHAEGPQSQVGLRLVFDDGSNYAQGHHQGPLEQAYVEDINPPLSTLVGGVLSHVEVSTKGASGQEGALWTFYKIHTSKGTCDIRWHGESNGYYSASITEYVDDVLVKCTCQTPHVETP